MFSFNPHPAPSIFILDSITFWFQQRLVPYYIALWCVLLSHRFMSELKDGCPIFCMDCSGGGIVCVLKALVRCALRTYGPHRHVILPDTGHFCHILPLACVSGWFVTQAVFGVACTECLSVWMCVCAHWYALDCIWTHNSLTVHMHFFVVKFLRLFFFPPEVINFRDNTNFYHLNGHFVHSCNWRMNTELEISQTCYMYCWNFLIFAEWLVEIGYQGCSEGEKLFFFSFQWLAFLWQIQHTLRQNGIKSECATL